MSFFSFTLIIHVYIGSYNVDVSKISVSGVSSGAAMASQMHIAFSNDISGVGIVAGRKRERLCCYLQLFQL